MLKRVAALLLASFVVSGCSCPKKHHDGGSHEPFAKIRPALSTLSGAQIEAYRKGVAAMKALPATDPRSWLYQASMHGFFDKATTVSPPAPPAFAQFAVPFVPHAQANNTWRQCKHGSDAFLVWHRVYLMYFERIMRAVSGQPHLMLPYWDYVVSDESRRRVPPAFRDPQYTPAGSTTPVDNPLYAVRRAALNAGTGALDAGIVDIATGLGKSQFYGGALGFNNAIEGTPHGNVHIAVSDPTQNGVMMGLFETAGQDAIFWTHHANIDRLWDCWLRRGNVNPATIATAGPFTFIDENGNVVTMDAAQLLAAATTPDYTYQDYSDCDAVPGASVMAMSGRREKPRTETTIAQSTKPVALSSRPAVVKITIPKRRARLLTPGVDLAERTDRVVLELRDITAAADPFVIYRVALRLDPGGEAQRDVVVGTFNFFGRVPVPGDPHASHGGPFTVELDVTDALVAHGARSPANAVEISITPTSGVTGETPATLDREFNREAKPSIAAVVLKVVPAGDGATTGGRTRSESPGRRRSGTRTR